MAEQFGRELSVFSMDNGALTLTHFCNVGNQVRLRQRSGTAPDVYEFDATEVIKVCTGTRAPRD